MNEHNYILKLYYKYKIKHDFNLVISQVID